MHRLTSSIAFFAALATFAVPVASLAATNGRALPIYPHTNHGGTAREPVNEKYINQAVIGGDTASLYTSDSPQIVARWYAQKLPKTCVHNEIGDGHENIQYGTRSVTITRNQNQTLIVLGPKPF